MQLVRVRAFGATLDADLPTGNAGPMGKVQHFELPADDVERAQAFYAKVFGWTYEDYGPDMAMVDAAGAEGETGVIGGDIFKRETPGDVPTVVLTVDSIEDSLSAIEAAGGSRAGDIQSIPEMGRFAYFIDPEGNRIGVWDTKL